MEKDFSKAFKEICDALLEEANRLDDDDLKLAAAVTEFLSKQAYSKNKLEIFWMLDYRLNAVKENLLQMQGIEEDKLKTLIIHYDFAKDIIADVMEEFEGRACSVDKASSILAIYAKDEDKLDNSQWYLPSKGTADDWKRFVEATLCLSFGKQKMFIEAKENIVKLYNEKEGEE